MWTQKICHGNVLRNWNINHHPMRNLKIRCIETFLLQEIWFIYFKKPCIFHFFNHLYFISHWNIQTFTWIFEPITCLVISRRWFINVFLSKVSKIIHNTQTWLSWLIHLLTNVQFESFNHIWIKGTNFLSTIPIIKTTRL
jgi:hypothetical protein